MTEFSDKPITVDGVKYQPKWPWSTAYRQDFRETHAKVRKDDGEIMRMDSAYKRWLSVHDK